MPSERDLYPEVVRTFRRLPGVYIQKKTDLVHALRARGIEVENSKSGHPDYTVIMPPAGFFIEVKAAGQNLPMAEVSPEQREWLDTFDVSSWLWLFLGDDRPGTKTARPRRAYLVPWAVWKAGEARLNEAGLSGWAYQCHQLAHREAGLDACSLLAGYALEWAGDRRWLIPYDHPLWAYLKMTHKLSAYQLAGALRE